jgi:hypothetical protein
MIDSRGRRRWRWILVLLMLGVGSVVARSRIATRKDIEPWPVRQAAELEPTTPEPEAESPAEPEAESPAEPEAELAAVPEPGGEPAAVPGGPQARARRSSKPAPGAGDGAPYGSGSARALPDGSAPSSEYTIKAKTSSMLFHPPSSPYYKRTKAEVWFRSGADAAAAGFTEWQPKRRSAG